MTKRVMLCLCSGYSGESQAFREDGEAWTVIRIDDSSEVCKENPGTLQYDVKSWIDWIDRLPRNIDLVWASPPCGEFTTAGKRPSKPDMSILLACKEIIDHLKPRHWIIENVRGARKFFQPMLGGVPQVIGPFWFWGVFPHLAVHVERKGKLKQRIGGRLEWCANPDGHWLFNGVRFDKWETPQNATIPYVISSALYDGVMNQMTLGDFP